MSSKLKNLRPIRNLFALSKNTLLLICAGVVYIFQILEWLWGGV